jgi:hypothetical protein
LDSKHGHELVYMLRVLLWDTLGASVGISTRTPYCSTVCLCLNNSLTHSLLCGVVIRTHVRRYVQKRELFLFTPFTGPGVNFVH